MLRALPIMIAVVLAIFSLIDLAMSPAAAVRQLPKWGWLLVILVPFAGPVAWLAVGRPTNEGPPSSGQSAPRRPVAPDDDPDFLNRIEQRRQQDERARLRDWEAELQRREQELGRRDGPEPDDDATGTPDQ